MRRWASLLALASAGWAETYSYWVQPCSAALARMSGCEAADAELAEWALGAWQRESQQRVVFQRSGTEAKARIRIYWAPAKLRLYGEARPILVESKRGSEVYVRPDLRSLGRTFAAEPRKDPLFRQAIIYLTCVHETGHALGLRHSSAFEDAMYSFLWGGDILEYFQRYRRKLESRADIRKFSGVSAGDRRMLLGIFQGGGERD
jgi:hypothetical protein